MSVKTLDVQIVTYRPDIDVLDKLLSSLRQQDTKDWVLQLRVLDNSGDAGGPLQLRAHLDYHAACCGDPTIEFIVSSTNLGFGVGHNKLAQLGAGEWLLILNQDVVLEPDAISVLVDEIGRAEANIAALEMREIPYEHPKDYDPATGDTVWVRAAAVLLRRTAFEVSGGFEPRIFLYGEDVELSWRLRAKGWRLRYVARAAVQRLTYIYPDEVKLAQVLGEALSNLYLRARYGTWRDIGRGVVMTCSEVMVPEAIPGRRLGLLANLFKFACQLSYFRRTRIAPNSDFTPVFRRWDYELRRDGAFHIFKSKWWRAPGAEAGRLPLVSILIRTNDNPRWLRAALNSIGAQTHRPLEVIIVETGIYSDHGIVAEFENVLDVHYQFLGGAANRAEAGNVALKMAKGDYINFLDEECLLYSDHVEILLDAVFQHNCRGAYSLAWEVQASPSRNESTANRDAAQVTRHRQTFNRVALWHHNYLPIQAVLFHRTLFEQHGGLDQTLDELEDWDLWIRYTLDDDFAYVAKTTSRLLLSGNEDATVARKIQSIDAYQIIKRKQAELHISTTPFAISSMVEEFLRNESVIHINKADIRRWVSAHQLLRTLASYRGRLMHRLLRRNTD